MDSVYDVIRAVQPHEIIIGIGVLLIYLNRHNLARDWQSIKRIMSRLTNGK